MAVHTWVLRRQVHSTEWDTTCGSLVLAHRSVSPHPADLLQGSIYHLVLLSTQSRPSQASMGARRSVLRKVHLSDSPARQTTNIGRTGVLYLPWRPSLLLYHYGLVLQ